MNIGNIQSTPQIHQPGVIETSTPKPSRWREMMLSVATVYAESPSALTIGGVTVGTLGNFSVSIGKAKSKKSFNVSAIAAAALSSGSVLNYDATLPPDKPNVLFVDTEQSKVDCQKCVRRILTLAGLSNAEDCDRLVFLALREATPEERIAIIDEAISEIPGIGLVIIDGIRDLLHDINNPTEASHVVAQLMKWTDRYQFHLHTVLHQNKSDENARGHVGTELDNKSETVMLVEKDKLDKEISAVKPVFTRGMEFEPFAFRIDEQALPELVDGYKPTEKRPGRPQGEDFDPATHIPMSIHEEALAKLFPSVDFFFPSYSQFVDKVVEVYKELLGQFNSAKANKVIQFYRDKGMTIQNSLKKYGLNPGYHLPHSQLSIFESPETCELPFEMPREGEVAPF